MKTFAIVPVKKFENGKMRLSSLLAGQERIRLLQILLEGTIETLKSASSISRIVVVSADRSAEAIAKDCGADFLLEEKEAGVNAGVLVADRYCAQAGAEATLVIPQDLALLKPSDLDGICNLAKEGTGNAANNLRSGCVVISPSLRYDGTNALLRKPPLVMETYYDNNSYQMHIKKAAALGADVKTFLSDTVMFDLDTPEDAKFLVASSENTRAVLYLRSMIKQDMRW
jgi:2-phospho-L-lactate guanylyltransferase